MKKQNNEISSFDLTSIITSKHYQGQDNNNNIGYIISVVLK